MSTPKTPKTPKAPKAPKASKGSEPERRGRARSKPTQGGDALWSRLAPRGLATARAAEQSAPLPRVISGPVSVYAFELPATKHRVVLFGDWHFSYEHLCKPCVREQGCATVTRFIREAAAHARARGTSLDVYLELPYVVRDGPRRTRVIEALEGFMARDMGPRARGKTPSALLNKLLHRIAGASSTYVGVFAQLYREFRADVYRDLDDGAGGRAKRGRGSKAAQHDAGEGEGGAVRFHHADARYEPHVARLLNADVAWLRDHVRTIDRLRALLMAILFSRDFVGDVRRLLDAPTAAKVLDLDALSTLDAAHGGAGRPVHKIAKQFLRLRDGPVKTAARRWIEDRVDGLMRVLRDDVGFGAGSASRAAATTPASTDADAPWKDTVQEVREAAQAATLPLVMSLGVWVLLMDAYLACRMLRFALQRPDAVGGMSVVYVGDAHAQFYLHLLRDYMGVAPMTCQPHALAPRRKAGQQEQDQPVRCVRLTAGVDARGACAPPPPPR